MLYQYEIVVKVDDKFHRLVNEFVVRLNDIDGLPDPTTLITSTVISYQVFTSDSLWLLLYPSLYSDNTKLTYTNTMLTLTGIICEQKAYVYLFLEWCFEIGVVLTGTIVTLDSVT